MKKLIHVSLRLLAGCLLISLPLAAQTPLKQSTAATVQIGPAVDASDGNTEVSDLTRTELEISKAGGIFAALNGSATLTHDDDGFYRLALTTSDTDTLGLLRVKVIDATAMTFAEDFLVLPANTFDSLYAGTDYLQTDVTQVSGSAAASDTTLETKIDTIDTVVDAIQAKTDNLPADPATETSIAALNDLSAVDFWTYGTRTLTSASATLDMDTAVPDPPTAGTVGAALRLVLDDLPLRGEGSVEFTDVINVGGMPSAGWAVYIRATNSRNAPVVAQDTTDMLGEFTVYLDPGTYYLFAYKSGYNAIIGPAFTVTAP